MDRYCRACSMYKQHSVDTTNVVAYIGREINILWAKAMRDPKPERLSLPLFALITCITAIVALLLTW